MSNNPSNPTTNKKNINIELSNNIVSNKVYYKMNFFINHLDNNTTIKKKKDYYIIKNNETKSKEFITDDYLDKKLCKLYKIKNNIDKELKIPHSSYKKNLSIEDISYNNSEIYKMGFLLNALNDGWSVKKNNKNFIFRKKHENKKEVYSDEYLTLFLKDKFNLNNIY